MIICFSTADLSGRGTITRTISGAATQLAQFFNSSSRLYFAADETLVATLPNGPTLRFALGANGNVPPIPDTGSPYGVVGP